MNTTLKKYAVIVLSLLFFFGDYINIHAENSSSNILDKINSKSKIEITGEKQVQIPVVGETIAEYKLKHNNLQLEKLTSEVVYSVNPKVNGVKIDEDGILTIRPDVKPCKVTIKANIGNKWSGEEEVELLESWIFEYEKNSDVKIRLANTTDVKEVMSNEKVQVIDTIIIILRIFILVSFILVIWYIRTCKKRYIENLTNNINEENEVE